MSSDSRRTTNLETQIEAPVELTTKPNDWKIQDLWVDCRTCIGACCLKGISLRLTDEELAFLESEGTQLQQIAAPHQRRFRATIPGEYELLTDCGLLKKDQETGQMVCSAYEDERRPQACSDFTMGCYHCREYRANHEVQPGERENFRIWKQEPSCM